MLEAFSGSLARHFHQAQRGNLRNGGSRRISRQRLIEHTDNLALVLVIGHVDEINDDDAAKVAQPELAGKRLGCLHIGLVDGFGKISSADITARIDVYGGHGFGLVNGEMTPGLERYVASQSSRYLIFHAVKIKQRPRAGIRLQSVGPFAYERVGKVSSLSVRFGVVEADPLDACMHEVAQ